MPVEIRGCCDAHPPAIRITLGWVLDSSVGSTFITFFVVVQVTGSNLTSNVSFTETLARAYVPEKHLPGSPGSETKRVGQRTDVYGSDAPNILPFRGGESVIRIALGWVIDRSFTHIARQVYNTFTLLPGGDSERVLRAACVTAHAHALLACSA